MNTPEQPTALRLASRIDGWHAPAHPSIQDCDAAAAELRRLSKSEAQKDALITELVEALEDAHQYVPLYHPSMDELNSRIDAALARAKEQR